MATLVAVYGAGLVTPLGWTYAGLVWAYAFAWFLLTDPVKLLAYKVLDTVKADAKPQAKAEPQPYTTRSAKPDAKAEPKAEAKPETKAELPPAGSAGPKSRDDAQLKPEAKAHAEPDAKAEPGRKPSLRPRPTPPPSPGRARVGDDTQARTEVKAEPRTGCQSEAKPDAPAASHPPANADMAALVGTTLGDIILAAVLERPGRRRASRCAAISRAEPPDAGSKEPEIQSRAQAGRQ